MTRLFSIVALLAVFSLSGCVTTKPTPYDYTSFKESRPRSILVLPPINKSPEVNASHSFASHVTYPLAEAGYYVFPVAVVEETFRQNGLTTPEDIHAVSAQKLREIFGADTALYITISDFGTQYKVLLSDTRVSASAKLIDLKTGKQLWGGYATASSSESDSNTGGGLIGMLVKAALVQAINTSFDKSHDIANITSNRLLTPYRASGILLGPYSPKYEESMKPTE